MAWNNINLENAFSKVRQSSSDHHRTFCSSCFDLLLSWWTLSHCGGRKWLYHPIYCILRNTILCWRRNISQYSSTLSKRVTTGPEQSYVLCNSGTCWEIFASGRIFKNLSLGLHFLTATFPRASPTVPPRLSRHTKNHIQPHVKSLPYDARPEWIRGEWFTVIVISVGLLLRSHTQAL